MKKIPWEKTYSVIVYIKLSEEELQNGKAIEDAAIEAINEGDWELEELE